MDLIKIEGKAENPGERFDDFSAKKLRRRCGLKKSLIKTHYFIWKSLSPLRATSIKSTVVYATILIRQIQILSFLVLKNDKALNSRLESAFNLLMFQTYSMKISNSDIFTNFSLVFGFFLYGCILCIFLQVFLKKEVLLTPFVIIIKFINFGLSLFLIIPILNNSVYYVKTNLILNDLFFGSEVLKKSVFLIHFLLISSHFLLFNLFAYESDYLSQEPKSRSSSLITFKEECLIILICILNQTVSQPYLLVSALVISVYELRDFAVYRPFYKFTENYLVSSKWLSFGLLSLLSSIEVFIGLDSQSLLCFLFMLPSSLILLYNYMKSLQDWSLGLEIKNPLLFELHLRKLLYRKKDLEEYELEEVDKLFEQYTPAFLGYKIMSIWESNFIIQIKEDYPLASIKLLKMIYSYKNLKFFNKPDFVFDYPLSIECEFHQYCLMKKLKSFDRLKENKLLKYIKDLIAYKNMDIDGCYKIVSLIDSYVSDNSYSKNELDRKYLKFYQSINSKEEFYLKCIDKYGNDFHFLEINTGFKNDLMIVETGTSTASNKTREFFVEKLTGNNNTVNLATLILSGSPEGFCKIIYANDLLVSLLKYPDANSIIGLNYQNLFHEIFPNQKDKFYNYILIENKTTIEIDQVFYIDYYGYAVEAGIEIRLSYLAGSYYFILYITQLNTSLNYILLNSIGGVITCSERLKGIINGYQHTIDDVLPGFTSLLGRKVEKSDFYYDGPSGHFLFKYCVVKAEVGKIYVVYTSEQDSSLNYSRSDFHNSRRKSISFSGKMIKDVITLKKSLSNSSRKNRLSAEMVSNTKEHYIDQSFFVIKALKLLRYVNIFAIILLTAIYISLSIYFFYFINDEYYANAIYNISSIRLNLAQTLLNLRSIDLINQGINCNSSFPLYSSEISKNFDRTETWLLNLTSYESDFSAKRLFEEPLVDLYIYSNGTVIKKTENLYQSIYSFNSRLRMVISSNFTDQESLLFLYRNGLSSIQNQVNRTLELSYQSISSKVEDMFMPVTVMTIITYFIFSIVLIISVFSFPKLQKFNQYYFKRVSSLPRKNLILMRHKIAERIKRLHDSTFSKHHEVNEPDIKYKFIGKKYLFCLFVLIAAIVGFGILTESLIKNDISKSVHKKLELRYYGGFRTISNRAFFWVRESNLRGIDKNIQSLFGKFADFSDESIPASVLIEKFNYVNHYYLSAAIALNINGNYNYFIEYLIGDSCAAYEFPGCSTSFLSKGIYNSVLLLVNDYKSALLLSNYSNNILQKLEQKTYIFSSNTASIFSIFDSCSSDFQSSKLIYISVTLLFSFLANVFFYFCIIKELSRINNLLLSRDIFLKFFEKDRKIANSSLNLSYNTKINY